jgi:hypothetical protein
MAKRIKIGDVMQILTSIGVSYAQVTHKDIKYSWIIRVFPETYPQTPKDFTTVVNQEPQFSAFFGVQVAVNRGLFAIVANVPIWEGNQKFPLFRGANHSRHWKTGPWWLWDGEKSLRLDRPLTEEEQKYPLTGFPSAPLIIEWIEQGYRAETHDL